jgi:ABC-type multidrug transport system fused ATPase/permease subunit
MKTILRLAIFIRSRWGWLALAFGCMIASTVFGIIIPRMLGDGIDTALQVGTSGFLWWSTSRETAIWLVAGTIIVASILRGFSDYGEQFLTEFISQKVSYDVRNAIYDRLQRLSFSYYDQAQTGQLMSRATVDVEAIRMFFGMGLLGIIQSVIMVAAISVILLLMDWKLALMTIAFLSFFREKEEGKKFADQATVLYDEQINVARQMAHNMPFMMFVMGLPVILILWYAGREVIHGTMTIGHLTQFILYVQMMVMPVRRMGMMVNLLSRTVSAGQRILEILDTESAVREKVDAIELGRLKGEVTFENVSFRYNSSAPTLKNVSFNAKPGQLVALLGGSGSGKSTIVNLISRFYDVSSGRITVDGMDIRDVTLNSLRKNVGISQQDIFLFSGTIRDNIAYGAVDASMEQIETVAKAAQFHDFVQTLPDGYDTWVGERGLTLSGGEKQRLAIARTLLINPSILILDDSTSSVDAETEHLIRQALDTLIEGRTTFIITHRLPIIKSADLILMLDKGQLVEAGKHNELMAKEGLYYQVYQSQLTADNDGGEDLERRN